MGRDWPLGCLKMGYGWDDCGIWDMMVYAMRCDAMRCDAMGGI